MFNPSIDFIPWDGYFRFGLQTEEGALFARLYNAMDADYKLSLHPFFGIITLEYRHSRSVQAGLCPPRSMFSLMFPLTFIRTPRLYLPYSTHSNQNSCMPG